MYGVIIDASSPYQKTKASCILKIVDRSLNMNSAEVLDKGKSSNTYITLQIFAYKLDELPKIARMGDIIRVHRCNVSNYQGKK